MDNSGEQGAFLTVSVADPILSTAGTGWYITVSILI